MRFSEIIGIALLFLIVLTSVYGACLTNDAIVEQHKQALIDASIADGNPMIEAEAEAIIQRVVELERQVAVEEAVAEMRAELGEQVEERLPEFEEDEFVLRELKARDIISSALLADFAGRNVDAAAILRDLEYVPEGVEDSVRELIQNNVPESEQQAMLDRLGISEQLPVVITETSPEIKRELDDSLKALRRKDLSKEERSNLREEIELAGDSAVPSLSEELHRRNNPVVSWLTMEGQYATDSVFSRFRQGWLRDRLLGSTYGIGYNVRTAAELLAEIGTDQAKDALVRALDTVDSQYLTPIFDALIKIGDIDTLPSLIKSIGNGEGPIFGLEVFGEEGVLQLLYAAKGLGDATYNPFMKNLHLMNQDLLLRGLERALAIPELRDIAQSELGSMNNNFEKRRASIENPISRQGALRGESRYGGPGSFISYGEKAYPTFRILLGDKDQWTIKYAIFGLRKDSNSRPQIENFAVNDPNPDVRLEAIYALRWHPESLDVLRDIAIFGGPNGEAEDRAEAQRTINFLTLSTEERLKQLELEEQALGAMPEGVQQQAENVHISNNVLDPAVELMNRIQSEFGEVFEEDLLSDLSDELDTLCSVTGSGTCGSVSKSEVESGIESIVRSRPVGESSSRINADGVFDDESGLYPAMESFAELDLGINLRDLDLSKSVVVSPEEQSKLKDLLHQNKISQQEYGAAIYFGILPEGFDQLTIHDVAGQDIFDWGDLGSQPASEGLEATIVTLENSYEKLDDKPVGVGGFAEVFRVKDKESGEVYAAKVSKFRSNSANAQRQIQSFEDEVNALKDVDHPNIVDLVGFNLDANYPYLIEEYLDGPSLDKVIVTQYLTTDQRYQYTREILSAFVYLQARGLVHRDVKPENIIVTKDGIKIVDFGVSEHADVIAAQGPDQEIVGTFLFLAPEQFHENEDGSHLGTDPAKIKKTDIYSIGATLYELYTGHKIYEGYNSQAHLLSMKLGQDIQPPSFHDPEIDSRLENLIMSMLNEDRDVRPTAQQALSDFEDIVERKSMPEVQNQPGILSRVYGWITSWFTQDSETISKAKSVLRREISSEEAYGVVGSEAAPVSAQVEAVIEIRDDSSLMQVVNEETGISDLEEAIRESDIIASEDRPLAPEIASRGYPKGFESFDEFFIFSQRIRALLDFQEFGYYDDSQFYVIGSSVHNGEFREIGDLNSIIKNDRPSDYDINIVLTPEQFDELSELIYGKIPPYLTRERKKFQKAVDTGLITKHWINKASTDGRLFLFNLKQYEENIGRLIQISFVLENSAFDLKHQSLTML